MYNCFSSREISQGRFYPLGFFFKPYLIYLLGRSIAAGDFQPEKFNKTLIYLLCTTALVATLDAIFIKGNMAIFAEFERVPGEFIYGGVFAPTFLGLKFHGSNGINVIAVFFSFAFMICLSLGVVMKPQRNVRLIACVGMLCSLILVLGSGSRQAAFGVIISCLCCFFAGRMTFKRLAMVVLYILSAFIASDFIVSFFSGYFVELFAKIVIMANNIYSGNWDGVSSGRLGLYVILAEDLMKSPIFGIGFSGYGLFDSELGYFNNDVSTSGYTPHNQYLGAIWKMGGLAGFFYIFSCGASSGPFSRIRKMTIIK